MKNFNLPQQKNIPTGQDSVYLLYGKLCPAKNGDDNFVTICEKITSKLNELPDDFELNDDNLKLIRNVIHHIVHNLRQVSEYGSEIDNKKKMIVWDLEILAKEYFETLKKRVDENITMEDIDFAWQEECLNKN